MNDTIRLAARRILISVIVSVQILFFPSAAFAQEIESSEVTPVESSETTEATPEETPPEVVEPQPTVPLQAEPEPQEDLPGPSDPPGPAGGTYNYNPETGMWESDYYIWNPATGQTSPKQEQTYSYNPITGMWDTTEWYYAPEQGKYVPNVISVAALPVQEGQQAAQALSPDGTGQTSGLINNTGPGSTNAIDFGGTNTGTFDLFFNASVSNKIGQLSRSGNATVQGNTNAGSALSGDASALANLLNLLQSSWGNIAGDDIGLFVANLDGDVFGDLYIDPSGLGMNSGSTDLDITVTNNASIDNDVDITVESGDATVAHNTNAGSATSGDAHAIVNLLNLINSAIKANKSFIGVLNINGDFNGDILLPPGMIEAIIASTGPNSNNQITDSGNSDIDVTTNNDRTIINDVTTDATSGNALVSDNTHAGNATTGNADTNIVLLNLTGHRVVAKNALLVFVNVLGTWTGLIFDAPAGSYAVAATGPDSTNTITNNHNLDADITINNTSLITNDIDVTAESGDATVSGNTNAGNARSGDASVGVNVLNMIDSEFSIDDWFGVLFINVFDSWIGSFGVDTAAGEAAAPAAQAQQSNGVTNNALPPVPMPVAKTNNVFSFIPNTAQESDNEPHQMVLSASSQDTTPPVPKAPATAVVSADGSVTGDGGIPIWVSGLLIVLGGLALGAGRLRLIVKSRVTSWYSQS